MSNTNQAASPQVETQEQIIARLMAENAALKASGSKPKKLTTPLADGLSCVVSEKGAISIYGLGRFPVTLYRHQFERLAGVMPLIQGFIQVNQAKLVTKPSVVK